MIEQVPRQERGRAVALQITHLLCTTYHLGHMTVFIEQKLFERPRDETCGTER